VGDAILLRPREAAKLLGVSRSKLYELIAAGAVPAGRLSKRVTRIPLAAIEALAREAVERAQQPPAADRR